MRVESIHLSNFKSYERADVDLTGVSLASVVGANGAGKSSLLEAIVFGFTGARGIRNLDSFIRQGCEECRVSVVFAMGEVRYRLTRTRSSRNSGKSTVELAREESGLWVAEGTGAREIDQRIAEILAVDEDILMLTSIVAQGDAGSFFALRPAQRLEAFGAILKLDEQYQPIERYWKQRADEAKADLEEARRDIERLEGDVEQLVGREDALAAVKESLADLSPQVEGAQADLEKAQERARVAQEDVRTAEEAERRLSDLRERQRALRARRDAKEQEAADLAARIAAKADLQAALAEREGLQAELERLEKAEREDARLAERRAVVKAELEAAQAALLETSRQGKPKAAELDRLRTQQAELKSRIDAIETAEAPVCDRCGQSVHETALVQTLEQLWREHDQTERQVLALELEVTALRERLGEQTADLQTVEREGSAIPIGTFDLMRYRAVKGELERLERIPAKLAEIGALEERRAALDEELKELSTQLHDPLLVEETAAAESACAAAAGLKDAALEATRQVKWAETELETRRRELGDLEKTAAGHEAAIALLAPSRTQMAQAHADARAFEEARADAELLRKAFSKWGIPALIVGNVLAALEREVNELLALYDGGLAVRFESERETRDGSRDSLEILVFDGTAWRPFETFSGGEKYRVASAMRLGLALLLAHRSGARVETLILDEPEGLDIEGRQHLVRILERLSENFGLVLVLSHYDDLKEALPGQIRVSRDEAGLSHVEVAG